MKHLALRFSLLALVSAALSLTQGCQSYDLVQRNIFADDDGNVVIVDYGRSEKPHVNTFISPVTGKEMEFKSKLVVEVQLPDGDDFTAWQCMNFKPYGTMYKTNNEKWMLLANGFSCIVYHRRSNEDGYDEVFRGVLCDTPEGLFEKNDKWKVVSGGEKGVRKGAPAGTSKAAEKK